MELAVLMAQNRPGDYIAAMFAMTRSCVSQPAPLWRRADTAALSNPGVLQKCHTPHACGGVPSTERACAAGGRRRAPARENTRPCGAVPLRDSPRGRTLIARPPGRSRHVSGARRLAG